MEDKQKQLDEALDRILSGPIGQNKEVFWDRAQKARDLSADSDILKKRGLSISKKLTGRKAGPSKRMKPIKAFKIIKATANKNSPIVGKTYIGTFDNAYKAAEKFNLNQGDIANVLRPKSRCISIKGYSFEYA